MTVEPDAPSAVAGGASLAAADDGGERPVSADVSDAAAALADAPLVPASRHSAVAEARHSAREAVREARQAEAAEANARRQHDALVMLRNIPFVEVRVVAALRVGAGGGSPPERGGGGSHVEYQIDCAVPRDVYRHATHSVQHRYSRFVALHEALLKTWGRHAELPRLPAKRFSLSGLSTNQIEERRAALQAYLVQLVTILNWAVEPNIRTFLEADRWLKERKTAPRAAAAGA